MVEYSQDLVGRFRGLYKTKFGKDIEYEVAKRELYELAHLIKKIYQ